MKRHLLCLAVALAACEGGPAAGPPSSLLTLGGLRAAYLGAPSTPLGVGADSVFTAGFLPSYFLASPNEVRIAPAFTEGRASAYISTDVWFNFPKVWVQPLYVFVTGFAADGTPTLADLPWVMGVGPASAFYSPYFRVTFVEVPPGTPPDRYRRVGDILGAGLRLLPGGTRLLTALPPGMRPEDPARILLPPLRTPGAIGLPVVRAVYVDGKADVQEGLDFGPGRFELGPGDTIVEQPLYFFFRKTDGAWTSISTLPRVGGTGPPHANRAPLAPGNRPAYGSFWRLWSVNLPESARVFVPSAQTALWDARNAAWNNVGSPIPLARIPEAIDRPELGADLTRHAFKVLLDDTCLENATGIEALDACPFLDSQAALERHLPTALWPSEIVVTCPYVAHDGRAVPPPTP